MTKNKKTTPLKTTPPPVILNIGRCTQKSSSVKKNFTVRRCHIIINPGETPIGLNMYMQLFYKYTKIIQYLRYKKSFRYLISGLGLSFDKKDTEHLLHIHIYIEFKEPTKISLKKIFNSHIISKIDSQLNTIQYIKDQELGIIEEIGEKALQHRPTIKEIENLDTDELKELDAQQYSNIIRKEITRRNNKINVNEYYKGTDFNVYYIYGASGIGKSRLAHQMIINNGYKDFEEVKYRNGFYNGCETGEGACLYDDFRPSHMDVSEFINFIDYNIHNLNIKGGNVKNRYKLIIITSINNPRNIYKNCTDNEETKTQWLRRLKIIHLE